ncbi:type I-E CRISPR-associated protein Cas6/Cse3/CasE [Gleimia hominis]|uniref:Type I-E CRISPR-associated protein Cas6/Cse3/CasE n=1 Tax=Gleimia hominis TaxID=595468 RepID=A0ABU3ICI6_9ACTO|nr:type I-E CRISPR-associated protein Cas6/Cse3/CasE [Gleimia hominis]MDT3766925.1 type I-E CRISPR-associated protein Cas6/Cse3/CasE [Gleimia hominis]
MTSTFSLIEINARRRGGAKLIANPQAMHAAVMSSFPPSALEGAPSRVLWRLDHDGPAYKLYVVSPIAPDFTHIVEQAGWAGQEWKSADYERFLDRITKGERYAFRLTANPVKREPANHGDKKTGPVRPLTVNGQIKWLVERAQKNGFRCLQRSEFDSTLPVPTLENGPTLGDAPALGDALTRQDADPLPPTPLVTVTRCDDARFHRKSKPLSAENPQSDRRGSGKSPFKRLSIRKAQFDGVLEVTDAGLLRSALLNGIGRAKGYGCGLMTMKPLT